MSNEYSDKVLALAQFLNVKPETINELRDDEFECEDTPGEYRVLTDSEADEAFDESVENYIDECVLSEIPEQYRNYFDNNAFKRDVKLGDGRGPSLSSYDGAENEEKVNGEWYFIYRTN